MFHLLLHLFDSLVRPLVIRAREYLSVRLWRLLTILINLVLESLFRLLLFITFLNLLLLHLLREDISVAPLLILSNTPHRRHLYTTGRGLLGDTRTLLSSL